MRKSVLSILAAGCVATVMATDARVITMGRSDNLFMDDVSIYKNPANINVYPNMLIGSMGIYRQDPNLEDTSGFNSLKMQNRDPQKPFFGGVLSYSLNKGDSASQYPMISLAAVINRYDHMLSFITPGDANYLGAPIDQNNELSGRTVDYVSPVGKVDVILGATLANGAKIGVGAYFAFQNETRGGNENTAKTANVVKGTVGVNLPVGTDMDLEVSSNFGLMSKIGMMKQQGNTDLDSNIQVKVADNDIFVNADLRLFSGIASINGDFVPHVGIEYVTFKDTTNGKNPETLSQFGWNAGVGVNMNIDRGFFWTGVEGFFEQNDRTAYLDRDKTWKFGPRQRIGGRASVGVERNVIWDWLVWRVGASKAVYLEQYNKGAGDELSRWSENAEADASDDDHVSFGMGLNIENRLKVDAVVAEDLFYTFTNLFSGNLHHFSTRITATYSF